MILALVRRTKIPSKRASSASLPASISNEGARLWPRLCADSADRRNCRSAPCRPSSIVRRARRRSLHGPCGRSRLPPRCGRGYSDASDLDLLDEELRLSRLRSTSSGMKGSSFSSTSLRTTALGALARAENVFELALLEPGDRCGRDHAAVGDDADPADVKSARAGGRRPATAPSHRRCCRAHLGANRPAVAVDDDGQDHLLQIGPMVLRVAVSAQAFAALAIKRQTGRVHEDGSERSLNRSRCQWRRDFPQKWRRKIPQSGGFGDQPFGVIGASVFGRPATAFQGRRNGIGGGVRLEADRLGQEVGVLAQPIAGALDLDDDGVVKQPDRGARSRRRNRRRCRPIRQSRGLR